MPLVINALGGGHTYTHIHRHTYQRANQSNFKKPGTRSQMLRAPGLKLAHDTIDFSFPILVSLKYKESIIHIIFIKLSKKANKLLKRFQNTYITGFKITPLVFDMYMNTNILLFSYKKLRSQGVLNP